MGKYILHRLIIAVPILIGISILTFFLIRLVPGDTVTAILGTNYDPKLAHKLRSEMGLDQPVILQYLIWIGHVFIGDFGTSSFTGQPVLSALMERLPITLELALLSLVVALIIAIPLGVLAACKHGTRADYASGTFGMFGISVPNFWLGTLLILIFSLHLHLLPSGGYQPLSAGIGENLRSLLMPVIALGTAVAAVTMRSTRSAMLDVLNEDYIKMAKAKGASTARIIWKHGLRNALVPVMTVVGIQIGYLLGGSVIIEQVFALPGMGRLALQAISNRDYSLLQGTILFVAVTFIMINLLIDVIYGWINPRIRYK
ncbi:ABC transporter permease [Sporolactobacillus inulinus]|uniref:Glutathione ABC transporter permease n=1 Tax=Sporolactobacillus inulinus CASD TaxID=1069536 RepID=A0A0U1QSV5_9BACL|nr:ABC transporter permease [Sporolactobacillus inulinus]KLI03883.1 glutathione ABC transporter permease [Sporolactobacillus inulinus CASD]GEB76898.1 peptide ABC transporter [Sporolactobacillus inulinus]